MSEKGANILEREANYFAMCLLMPEELLRRELRVFYKANPEAGLDETVKSMARLFQVEDAMMTLRLGQLSLIDMESK